MTQNWTWIKVRQSTLQQLCTFLLFFPGLNFLLPWVLFFPFMPFSEFFSYVSFREFSCFFYVVNSLPWMTAWRRFMYYFWLGHAFPAWEWQRRLPPKMPHSADKKSWQRIGVKPLKEVEPVSSTEFSYLCSRIVISERGAKDYFLASIHHQTST